eukprot:CAMPEP_0172319196 /NCGR_PEP_ID=MMETSP1058-20130122/37081_1 /TAXON_ID=83371 /ORGANISM="Detonula confervacea, Strain CCMP 353" /LENGTH=295 /DNA_ID=CAMNT_0013034195 /DNA_START=20 /DNA_END=907 /DNA_ORIENTATION=-
MTSRPSCCFLALLFSFGIQYTIFYARLSSAFQPQTLISTTKLYSSPNENNDDNANTNKKIYFDIAIPTPNEEIPLGRLTFHIIPPNHPHHLPLHISNLISLSSSQRKSIDSKATYEGCTFQYSPSTIEDGSFRYRWGHVCDGYGRNGIQTTSASGVETNWDEPFSDPERIKECSHSCFGGVYYGQRYDEIVNLLANENNDGQAVLLTVPIRGPGAGTSKFSIVRVSESPREWGERLLLNSAVVGYLDCGANGSFGESSTDGENGSPTALEVFRAMARQRMGPPKIINCGVTPFGL